jgi:RNA recognition motif-containing protein
MFSSFANEDLTLPPVSSSFPDQFLLRSAGFPPSVAYPSAQRVSQTSSAATPSIALGSFGSSSSPATNWSHPSQYSPLTHHSHDANHQTAFLSSGPMHPTHVSEVVLSTPTQSADVLMRRRAVSVGANASATSGMSSPYIPPSSGSGSAANQNVGATGSGANPLASAVAAAAGGAISTKHSSRVIAVINLDALHEAGVDLQALYDIFQHFGAVRSLDTVAATPESTVAGQSPLNISFLPIQRGSGVQNAIALVSFYDLRHSQKAMAALNGKILPAQSPRGGEPLSLQLQYFVLRDFPGAPSTLPAHQQPSYQPAVQTPFNQYQNQGTLVIFNLDPSVSNEELRDIFSHFGEVKEIRESPNKKHKFVEFFDVRCAEKAMRSLNKTDIKGRKIKIEPSRPGGTQSRKSPPIPVPVAGSLSSVPSAAIISPSSYDQAPAFKLPPHSADLMGSLDDAPFADTSLIQSLSDLVLLHQQAVAEDRIPIDSLDVLSPSTIAGLGSSPLLLSSHLYPHLDHSTEMARDPPGGETEPQVPLDKVIPILRLPLPSLPEEPETEKAVQVVVVVNKPLAAAARRSQRSSSMPPKFNPAFSVTAPAANVVTATASSSTITVSKGRKRSSSQSIPSDSSSPQTLSATSSAVGSPGSSVSSSPVSSPGNSARGPAKPAHSPGASSHMRHPQNRVAKVSGFIRRERSCSEGSQRLAALRSGALADDDRSMGTPSSKFAFELDLTRVRNGEDVRTTLMIKNIPNKYDQEMLLLAINRQHVGLYDFFYLPIDFKNKCNVGYAFINFIDPRSICTFFEEFNNKKWERFNSEKVCQITYARIQGKNAMVEHFKNSSLMFEDAKCRPLLFYSDGEQAGTAEPFPSPTGRPRPSRRESVESSSEAPSEEELSSAPPS